MAFEIENFKEAGGDSNNPNGGQLYTVVSGTDNLVTMQASAYLDDIADTLNIGDLVIFSATNGSAINRITSDVIPVTTA